MQLAKHFNTVVLSADSRQFYKETSIGTAKPTPEEMDGVPHYFIDSHSIFDPVTAGTFEQEAVQLLQGELFTYQKVILVGGSGMFIDALCKGLDPIPTDALIQEQLRQELDEKGLEPLLEELKQDDPVYYEQVDRQNAPRVLRALEVFRLTGIPFSEQRSNNKPQRPFQSVYFHINHPREILYERINKRVDMMMEQGLLDEVTRLYPHRNLTSLQTVGYKELFDYLDQKCTLEFAIDKIKQHTRNYAKRQMTWINRNSESIALEPGADIAMLQQVLNQLSNNLE